jgi:hypothetical protein
VSQLRRIPRRIQRTETILVILDDAKQLTEFAELALSRKLRNYGRTDAEMDERAGARIVDELNLKVPATWDGRALCGLLGSLERHGMSMIDLRHFAEQRLEQITPVKRPDPVFTSAPTITEEDKADLATIAENPATSRIVRELVREEMVWVKKPRRRYRRS